MCGKSRQPSVVSLSLTTTARSLLFMPQNVQCKANYGDTATQRHTEKLLCAPSCLRGSKTYLNDHFFARNSESQFPFLKISFKKLAYKKTVN